MGGGGLREREEMLEREGMVEEVVGVVMRAMQGMCVAVAVCVAVRVALCFAVCVASV